MCVRECLKGREGLPCAAAMMRENRGRKDVQEGGGRKMEWKGGDGRKAETGMSGRKVTECVCWLKQKLLCLCTRLFF